MIEANDLPLDFNLDDIELTQPAATVADTPVPQASLGQDDTLRKMSLFSRIPVNLTLEVASVNISLAELMTLTDDSVVELDKMAGEALDIKVNGILFGKAEVVVLNDKYGLRIIEFSNHDLNKLAQ